MKKNCVKRVHIFDLDHTLLKGNSCFHFGSYLFKNGYLSFCKMLSLLWRYWLCTRGKLSMVELHTQVFERLFLGQSKQHFVELVNAFIKKYREQLFYLPALSKLKEAKERGELTAICSSAPDFLVECFSSYLNVDEWCASNYLVDKRGAFCVISMPVEGKEKANYVHSLQERYSLRRDQVIAYSDSIRDLLFLQSAGRAIGVKPDPSLLEICHQENWEIL